MHSSPTWSETLCVGNSEIDTQHKQLITICARAAECASSTSYEARKEFHDILNDLATLTDKHFADEENLLIKNGSPHLDAHKAEHDVYRGLVVNLLVDGMSGLLDRARLYEVANEYLIKHMQQMDLADKAYLRD